MSVRQRQEIQEVLWKVALQADIEMSHPLSTFHFDSRARRVHSPFFTRTPLGKRSIPFGFPIILPVSRR
jgi:hypothetical protein